MRLRVLLAATLLPFSMPCLATPVSITPGTTVTPGTGLFGGELVDEIVGTNHAGSVLYVNSVFADPDNPLCAGCYDFVFVLLNYSTRKDAISVTAANFNGDKYALAVAYEDLDFEAPNVPPSSATESPNGKRITFDLDLGYLQISKPLIIYTNALNDKDGTLSIKLGQVGSDPPAFAPAGKPVAVTPEPSSLLLLGTGALGMIGTMRRRFA